jgi:hypothetical protein
MGCIASQKNNASLIGKEKIRLTKLYYEKAINLEQQNQLIESKKNY